MIPELPISWLMCGGGLLGLLLIALYLTWQRDPRVATVWTRRPPLRDATAVSSESWMMRSCGRLTGLLLPRSDEGRSELRQLLVHAGYPSATALTIFVLLQVLLALAVGAAGIVVWRANSRAGIELALIVVVSGCAGYLLPRLWLRRRKSHRIRVLNRSLPDFLDLLVACVEAGLSLEGALQRVSMELGFAHPLLGQEIARVQAEIELGATPDRALQSCAERTESDVVRTLSRICQQSRKFGVKVSSALRVHADVLRNERELAAEEAAQKASVKILFPTLLLLFPAIFVVLAGPAAIQITENFSGKEAQASQERP